MVATYAEATVLPSQWADLERNNANVVMVSGQEPSYVNNPGSQL
jgi:hypothetical protein